MLLLCRRSTLSLSLLYISYLCHTFSSFFIGVFVTPAGGRIGWLGGRKRLGDRIAWLGGRNRERIAWLG